MGLVGACCSWLQALPVQLGNIFLHNSNPIPHPLPSVHLWDLVFSDELHLSSQHCSLEQCLSTEWIFGSAAFSMLPSSELLSEQLCSVAHPNPAQNSWGWLVLVAHGFKPCQLNRLRSFFFALSTLPLYFASGYPSKLVKTDFPCSLFMKQ
jgi:hypothetical protein